MPAASSEQNRKLKKVALFVGFFIASFVVTTGMLANGWFDSQEPSEENLRLSFLECFTENERGQILRCLDRGAETWVPQYGTALSDELLYYQTELGADSICHLAGHVVGEHLYKNYGLSALSECTPACYGSCQHGVLGAFEAEHGASAFVEQVLANNPCEEIRGENWNAYSLCIHGLGHAFELAYEYDYRQAADTCWEIDVPNEWLKRNCVSGVFMELFGGTIGGHYVIPPEIYSKDGEMFYPCTSAEVSDRDRWECFSQIPVLVYQNPDNADKSALQICEEHVPEQWQRMCARGMGLTIIARDVSDVQRAIQACRNTEQTALKTQCLSGALFYARYDPINAESATKKFCEALTEIERQDICSSVTDQS